MQIARMVLVLDTMVAATQAQVLVVVPDLVEVQLISALLLVIGQKDCPAVLLLQLAAVAVAVGPEDCLHLRRLMARQNYRPVSGSRRTADRRGKGLLVQMAGRAV